MPPAPWPKPISIHRHGELGFEGALGNPYLYTGRRYDPETGLYYYRARMYSAAHETLPPARSHWIRRRDEYVCLRGE